jgi:hypothetical protein
MTTFMTIGCSLPHGLTLEVASPVKGEPPVHVDLNGSQNAPRGQTYGTAKVPMNLWMLWVSENNTLRYVVEASVFVIDGKGRKLHPLTLKELPPEKVRK